MALADEQSTGVCMMGLEGEALRMSFNHGELILRTYALLGGD